MLLLPSLRSSNMFRSNVMPQTPIYAAASAAASEWESVSSHNPPTALQLASLSALPSALYSKGTKGKGKSGSKRLAREGQVVSKMFDAYGARPMPRNGISLEQSVTLEMTYVTMSAFVASVTAGLPTYFAKAFTLNDFAGGTALRAVFDQYRFEQIETWFEFVSPTSGAVQFPELSTAVDLDDASVPTAIGQVLDRVGSVTGTGPGGHYHKWKPHVAVAAFSGAFTSYSNEPACWIDSGSPGVEHYGIKAIFVSNGSAQAVNITTRAVITFRSPCIN